SGIYDIKQCISATLGVTIARAGDDGGMSYKTIARLLTLKSANVRGIQHGAGPLYERTEAAVGKKLRRIRDERPELWIEQEGKWDWEAVSRYLHDSQIDQVLLDKLLVLTDDDIETINQTQRADYLFLDAN
ncbi:hypothetical protein KXW63_009110, partial [Aspergillus fumigatus]